MEGVKRTLEQDEKCPFCGAKKKMYWHNLSAGLVQTLAKFAQAIKVKGVNDIHVGKDLVLDNAAYNNFNKLKYWGLVVKTGVGGHWKLTEKGTLFLQNKIAINKRVKTFRNKVEEKDENRVTVQDCLNGYHDTYWQQEFGFDIRLGRVVPADYQSTPVQQTLV